MGKTVLGVFKSRDKAEEAVKEIRERGFRDSEINLIAKDDKSGQGKGRGTTMSADVSRGSAAGTVIGGAAGLLASAGALAIPGIGPIVAAGPIAAALSGAVTGGIAGGLIDWGIPEERGRHFEEKVKEGGVLAIIKTGDDKASSAEDILRKNGAFDVESHVTD